MKREATDCRAAQRFIMRESELDAVTRTWLDVHLRRCAACRDIGREFAQIEAGFGEILPLDEKKLQEIYTQLVPAVHEIASGKKKPELLKRPELLNMVWKPRPIFAMAAGMAAAAVLLITGAVFFASGNGSENRADSQKVQAVVAKGPVVHEGFVDRNEGTVRIDDQDSVSGGKFQVRKGTKISLNKNARFSFRISDVAKVALSGESDWQLKALTPTFLAIKLDSGRLAVDFDSSAGKVMEVETPDSVVRVKGTVFTVEAVKGGETRVSVLRGKVEVIARNGEARTLEVGQGKLVTVPGDGEIEDLTDDQRSLAAELRTVSDYPDDLTRIVRFDGSPERVKVEVDGRVVGTTPLTVRLPAGPFSYQLTSPGMEPVVGKVTDSQKTKRIGFSMMPFFDFSFVEDDAVKETPKKKTSMRSKSRRRRAKAGWDLYERARAAMTAGDIPYAIGLLERALESANGRRQKLEGLSMLAECYAAAGSYAKAANAFDQIREEAPDSSVAQNARYEVGRLAMDQLGDLSRARAAFTAYVASPVGGSLREEAYYSLCELDGREGAHRNALHCFNQFLRTFPGGHHEPDARLWRGVIYQDMKKNWGDAERDLLAFIKARPTHPRADEATYRVVLGRYQAGDRRGTLRMIADYLKKHPQGQYRVRVERLRQAVMDPSFMPKKTAQ